MNSISTLHFLVKSTSGVTTDKFLIKDLTGTSGRLDIIFRCVLAAFSFGINNICFHTVLHGPPNAPKAVEFDGNQLETLPIDEIGMAKLFQSFLQPGVSNLPKGVMITKTSFVQLTQKLGQKGPLFLLKEGATPIQEYINDNLENISSNSSLNFVLSDSVDLERNEEDFLINTLYAIPISLGANSYLASHCIIFLLMKMKQHNIWNSEA